MTSVFFEDLSERYVAEIDDLRTDSQGRDMLERVLQQKRSAFKAMLPMLEEAPEMIVPAFHGAFRFTDRKILDRAASTSPGFAGFPRWTEVSATLELATWAHPLADLCLKEPDGDAFMVIAAVLEWMLQEDIRRPDFKHQEDEADDDQDLEDLGQAGEGWMSEQGFDSIER